MKKVYPMLILTDAQKDLLLKEYQELYFAKYNSQKSKNSLIKHILKMKGINLRNFTDKNLAYAFEAAMYKVEEKAINLDKTIKKFMRNLMEDLINDASAKCEVSNDNEILNNLIDTILHPILWSSYRKLTCHIFINSENNSLKVLYLTDEQHATTHINIAIGMTKFTVPGFRDSINRNEREFIVEDINDDILLKLLLIKNRMFINSEDFINQMSSVVLNVLSIHVTDYYDVSVL